MVRAWYMDDSSEDQRLEHHRNPSKFIEIPELCKSTGVEHFKVKLQLANVFLCDK